MAGPVDAGMSGFDTATGWVSPGGKGIPTQLDDMWQGFSGQYDPSGVADQQAEVRGDQRGAEKMIGQWGMTGNGPSAAQAMIERNRAQNAANQLGMAKSMGGDPALANRNAAEGIAQGSAAATYQGSVIKAEEQKQAMQQYLDSLHATRAQDLARQQQQYNIGQQNAANKQQAYDTTLSTIGDVAGMAMG